MNTQFVYLGCSNEYDMITYRETNKVLSEVIYYPDPYHSLHGIKKFVYEAHNSRKINRIIKLPLKKIWAKTFFPESIQNKISSDKDLCFIFNEFIFGFLENGILEYIAKEYPTAKTICLFDDRIDKLKPLYGENIVERSRDLFDYTLTYNQRDAREYNLIYSIPSLIDYSFVKDNPEIPKMDVFYIGRAKERLDSLIDVFDVCTSKGLFCKFFIVDVPESQIIKREGIIYNKRLSYEKLLEYCKRSKCILNITQEGAEGVTLRDYEAVSMNKYLITNNPIIEKTIFYTPEKVIKTNDLFYELDKITEKNDLKSWNGLKESSVVFYYAWLENDVLKRK